MERSALSPSPLPSLTPTAPLDPPHHPIHACIQVQPDLATDAECRACYRGLPLLTSAGPCTVRSVQGGSIR